MRGGLPAFAAAKIKPFFFLQKVLGGK
jgi:hypothetical protein